jgi:iron complex transport system substrate-binding protein
VRILEAQPEVLILACYGYSVARTLEDLPLLQRTPGWETLPAVQRGRVYAVDGSAYFSRPGPRIVDSLEILAACIHPAQFPEVRPMYPTVIARISLDGRLIPSRIWLQPK